MMLKAAISLLEQTRTHTKSSDAFRCLASQRPVCKFDCSVLLQFSALKLRPRMVQHLNTQRHWNDLDIDKMGNVSSVAVQGLPSLPLTSLGASGQKLDSKVFSPSDGFFLQDAARQGNSEVVELFLDKNPALAWAVSQADKNTPWHSAAREGHLRALQLLADVTKQAAMSNTFNPTSKAVNQADSKGRTPLMLACLGGHFTCVDLLLSLGAELTPIDDRGFTALHYAALTTHGGCVELLLKKAGLWNSQGPAAHKDMLAIRLINAGDVPYGRTPLHLAAWTGQSDGVAALLAAGAHFLAKTVSDCFDSSLPCNTGTTALHLAAMKGHQDIMVMILEAYVKAVKRGAQCADPRTVQDAYNNTAHRIALSRKHDVPLMLQILNPATVIKDVQKYERRCQEEQSKGVQIKHENVPSSKLNGGAKIDSNMQQAGITTQQPGEHANGNVNKISTDQKSSPVKEAAQVRQSMKDGDSVRPAAIVGNEQQVKAVSPEKLPSKRQESDDISVSVERESGGPATEAESETETDESSSGSESDTSQDDELDISNLPDKSPASPSHAGNEQSKPLVMSIKQMKSLLALYSSAKTAVGGKKLNGTASLPSAPGQPIMPSRSNGSASSKTSGQTGSQTTGSKGQVAAKVEAYKRATSEPPASLQHTQLSEQPVPDLYLCPLTCRIFTDPVVAADGYSYERTAIEKHIASGNTLSPSTKKRLTSTALYPNYTLKKVVESWKAEHKVQAERV